MNDTINIDDAIQTINKQNKRIEELVNIDEKISLALESAEKKLDQYKNNWEELKTYLNMVVGMNFNMNNDKLSEQKVDDYTNILNKMKELEEDI